ncbi:glycerate kinase [soil metagenome]
MERDSGNRLRRHLEDILSAGLRASDPGAAVGRCLSVEGGRVKVRVPGGEEETFEPERVFVLAAGKAAGPMAGAAVELLGGLLSGGLVLTKDGHAVPESAREAGLEVRFAAHPEPDGRGEEAASRAAKVAEELGGNDLLLCLISGGASALLADPDPSVGLGDLGSLTGSLLRSGASISEINTVRKHISTLKGGGLARLAAPASVISLLLSDVVGDDPSAIASGPTVPDPTTLDEARAILDAYEIEPPASVVGLLRSAPETAKADDVVFEKVTNVVCGGGGSSVEAAAQRAAELGYEPLIVSTYMNGDARGIAAAYAAMIRESRQSGNPSTPPCALVSGGEATVVVRGDEPGEGGPNQELALALALELDGVDGWAALAADTDGNDGSTEAAGGVVDGETAARVREAGVDPAKALSRNDSRRALEAGGALLVTGPTGTNVNDLRIALVEGERTEP